MIQQKKVWFCWKCESYYQWILRQLDQVDLRLPATFNKTDNWIWTTTRRIIQRNRTKIKNLRKNLPEQILKHSDCQLRCNCWTSSSFAYYIIRIKVCIYANLFFQFSLRQICDPLQTLFICFLFYLLFSFWGFVYLDFSGKGVRIL